MQELAGAICLLANGKAVGPDGVSVELFKITLNGVLDIIVRIWRGDEVPQQWKYAIFSLLPAFSAYLRTHSRFDLVWFRLDLVTTAGFVADQLMRD